jgi:hypothetical protein
MTTSEADVDGRPRSFAWACETGGALTPSQRAAIKRAVRRGYRTLLEGLVTWPFRRSDESADLPTAPDSTVAKEAEEAAKEQGAAIEGHGYRTWLLGAALADRDGVVVDPELFYITSLLHDAGIVRAVSGQDFTVRSGELLIAVCRRAGCDDDLGVRAADAAVAHATPGLLVTDDPVGFYVQAGAMADLGGLRMWDLPRGQLRRAYTAHPGAGVHATVARMIRNEATCVPEGRFALLKRAGMDLTVTASPTRFFDR